MMSTFSVFVFPFVFFWCASFSLIINTILMNRTKMSTGRERGKKWNLGLFERMREEEKKKKLGTMECYC